MLHSYSPGVDCHPAMFSMQQMILPFVLSEAPLFIASRFEKLTPGMTKQLQDASLHQVSRQDPPHTPPGGGCMWECGGEGRGKQTRERAFDSMFKSLQNTVLSFTGNPVMTLGWAMVPIWNLEKILVFQKWNIQSCGEKQRRKLHWCTSPVFASGSSAACVCICKRYIQNNHLCLA